MLARVTVDDRESTTEAHVIKRPTKKRGNFIMAVREGENIGGTDRRRRRQSQQLLIISEVCCHTQLVRALVPPPHQLYSRDVFAIIIIIWFRYTSSDKRYRNSSSSSFQVVTAIMMPEVLIIFGENQSEFLIMICKWERLKMRVSHRNWNVNVLISV